MGSRQADLLASNIRRLVAKDAFAQNSDRELLERFIRQHEQPAFAALMFRHGRMVLSVSQRIVQDVHVAEDVLQATFLLFLRKAATLQTHQSIGPWLHEAARRLALKARSERERRHSRESRAREKLVSDPVAELTLREAQAAVDQELARLPERYRAPLILCCLEGMARDEAAQQLGWSLNTLKGRLEQARQLLRARLTRRGLTLPAALLAVLFGESTAKATLSASLVASTAKAASALNTGGAATAGLLSPQVTSLLNAGMRVAWLTKFQMAAALLVGACVFTGVGLATWMAPLAKQPDAKQEKKKSDSPGTTEANVRAENPPATDRYGDPLPERALARLGTTRFRQGFMIYTAAYSPDGKMLATTSAGQGICVWDTDTGKQLYQVLPHAHVHSVAFAPNGKVLVTGGAGRGIHLFDAATGRQIRKLPGNEGGGTMSLAVSPDSKVLASGGHDCLVRLWDMATGQELRQLEGHGKVVNCLAFSPDGEMLASGGLDTSICLWETSTGKPFGELAANPGKDLSFAWSFGFSPDGRTLVSGGEDKTIRLWDVSLKRVVRLIPGTGKQIARVSFSPDGSLLASGQEDGTIHMWDPRTGKEHSHWQAHKFRIQTMAFSPKGHVLATGAAWDSGPRLWDVATGKEIHSFAGHHSMIEWLSYTPDGKALLSATRDKEMLHWDLKTGRPEPWFSWHSAGFDRLAVAPERNLVATCGYADRTLRLLDTTGTKGVRELGKVDDLVPRFGFASLVFSPDRRLLATGAKSGNVLLWNPDAGTLVRRFEGLREDISCVAFSPDGKSLAAAACNLATRRPGSVCVWDIATGNQLSAFRNADSTVHLAFSPDGKSLAVAGGGDYRGKARVFDITNGKERRPLQGPQNGSQVVAFSPDGRLLAGAGDDSDRTVHLWEVCTGQQIYRFNGHTTAPNFLTFAPDGRSLASGGTESMILIWDLTGRARNGRLQPARLTPGELQARWNLLSGDAPRAEQAIWDLVASSKQGVIFLREKLQPAKEIAKETITGLIRDLNADRFAVRQKATAQLQEIGEQAEAALRDELTRKPPLEVRQRIDQLLVQLEPADSPERIRMLRAIRVLEYVGTPEAKQVLERLAGGAPAALMTQEAKASLERLERRPVSTP
jgi:RNA polymerase sigma factor (sigma-70 family)